MSQDAEPDWRYYMVESRLLRVGDRNRGSFWQLADGIPPVLKHHGASDTISTERLHPGWPGGYPQEANGITVLGGFYAIPGGAACTEHYLDSVGGRGRHLLTVAANRDQQPLFDDLYATFSRHLLPLRTDLRKPMGPPSVAWRRYWRGRTRSDA